MTLANRSPAQDWLVHALRLAAELRLRRALLLLFDRRAAALHRSGAAFGYDNLTSARAADVNLAELVSHYNRFTPDFLRPVLLGSGALEKRPALFKEGLHAFRTVGAGL